MAHAKQASRRKRRRTALPALGIAGASLSLVGSAAAATGGLATDIPWWDTAARHEITLGEEEISDVSLATFYVFDKENAGASDHGQGLRLARGGGCGGGCGGCGGRGCGGCGGCRGCGGGFGGCGGGIGGCRGGFGGFGGCRGCGFGGRGCGGWWGGGCSWGGCSCCLSWGACSYC
jgi:hypothetical protein